MGEQQKKNVEIENKTVDSIFAENVTANKIGVKSLNASKIDVNNAGIGYVNGQTINQKNCGNGIVKAKTIKADSLKAIFAIADNVEGDVQTVLDKKGAAVFGLVIAAFFMFFRILRRLTR